MDELFFKVAPHAIEDLGSNLYTSFPRVLAEFVANAYDADATKVEIVYDFKKIASIRRQMARSGHSGSLDKIHHVSIRDDGVGMTMEHLNERFLWAGRKRRTLEPLPRTTSRPLMGRKGLGKLAGFGVASILEVITKTKGEDKAIHISLDYDAILKQDSMEKIPVDWSHDVSEFKQSESGTVVRLSKLNFDAVKSKQKTVFQELAQHFEFISPSDFRILLNGHAVPAKKSMFKFAWPAPTTPSGELIDDFVETELGRMQFKWRIRFRGDRKALPAEKRGVRIYSHNRLAAAPSLLEADTNMHGFRMTDYMDGVVNADFIDDQSKDYINTNRQSLRWDTPLLAPLKDLLSEQIKKACSAYQAERDKDKHKEVREDSFTKQVILGANLGARETNFVQQIAFRLASFSTKGIEDPQYKATLPQIARAVGHGDLYVKLTELAEMERPDLRDLITEVVKLNRNELDGSVAIVRSKIKAIEALKKEVGILDSAPRNESAIQELFEMAPWLMNPVYREYLTADKSMNQTLIRLAEALEISKPVGTDESLGRREPDIVFLLGSRPLRYVLIVELKAVNKPAEVSDVLQLRGYIVTAKKWLKDNHHNAEVRGELICSPPDRKLTGKPYEQFWNEVDRLNPDSDHRVRSYTQVLEETTEAHQEILDIASRLTFPVLE